MADKEHIQKEQRMRESCRRNGWEFEDVVKSFNDDSSVDFAFTIRGVGESNVIVDLVQEITAIANYDGFEEDED